MDDAICTQLTSSVEVNSKEVAQAINVFDLYGYFYERRRFLRSEIERLGSEIEQLEKQDPKLKDN